MQTNSDLVSGEITPAAWMTEDGRVCTAQTKDTAMPSQVAASFNIPLDTRPAAHDDLVKALQRLLDSDKGIATATEDELVEASNEGEPIVREQAAAVLQARAALRKAGVK